ncbi:MAG: ABC transporter ATP-binding protein/permease [Bacteroidetes bacterium]|nr:ABC transporter ATP-binding protein/permease [Bacteroidota bacterium]
MHEEEVLGKAYDSRLMRRLLKYLRPYTMYVILGILMSILMSILEAIRPLFTKIAVDENIKTNDTQGLLSTIALLAIVIILRASIQFANAYLTQWIGQRAIYDLRKEIYHHLQTRALSFFDRNPIGRLITRVTNDVEVLNEMFSSGIVLVFSDIFTIVGILYFMFTLHWQLALVTLSVLPFLFYGTFLFREKVRKAYRNVRIHLARINTFMQEHITGILIDKLFTREVYAFNKFSSINADHRDANIKSIFYYAVFYPSVDCMGALAVGLLLWYSGIHALDGTITLGTVMAFVQFNEMFWRPIRDLSEKYNILQTAMASSERIFQLLDTPLTISTPLHPHKLENVKGSIEFRNVWFAYGTKPDGTPDWVLKDISFTIEAGQTVAIVGHTGAGKTSLMNVLTRLYDIQQGTILLDGIPLSSLTPENVRRIITVVPQDIFLFSGTIHDNITLGDPAISFERVQAVARFVGLHQFIEQLPDKYNTVVKERGAILSVGQKQLLTFARALAHNPKILILDEATSNIDTESEQMIQNAIKKMLKGRTSIVIAHRLSTIQRAHCIIVLHKGELRELGTHSELLSLNGIYRKLYELQYKEQELYKY